MPVQAYADTNGIPPGDERARELERGIDDAAGDVAEALDEAREVAECGGVEPWRAPGASTWTAAERRRLHAEQWRRGIDEPDGWIVRMPDC